MAKDYFRSSITPSPLPASLTLTGQEQTQPKSLRRHEPRSNGSRQTKLDSRTPASAETAILNENINMYYQGPTPALHRRSLRILSVDLLSPKSPATEDTKRRHNTAFRYFTEVYCECLLLAFLALLRLISKFRRATSVYSPMHVPISQIGSSSYIRP